MKSIVTYLLFVGDQAGNAEEAIHLYTSVFPDSVVHSIERHEAGGSEPEGSVKMARFSINGAEYMAMDSSLGHQFTFTPAISFFIECDSAEELDRAYHALSEGGSELMPLGDYGFSERFGWLNDRYGVSWQLNLA